MSIEHVATGNTVDVTRIDASDSLSDEETEAVRAVLDRAFDGTFTNDDWHHALGGHHVVVRRDGVIIAHGAVVPRRMQIGDAEWVVGYVEAVATDPAHQGRGAGTWAMEAAAAVISERYGLGVLSTSAHGFYERLGWHRWHGPSWVRRAPGDVLRTPDEDDGIMAWWPDGEPPVDVHASITCDERVGDDW